MHFVGQKKDVTSDVLKAVIDKAEFHGGSFDIEGGNQKWVVTVTEVKEQEWKSKVGCYSN